MKIIRIDGNTNVRFGVWVHVHEKSLFLPVVSVVIAFKNELKWLKLHIEGGHNLPFQSTRISFEVVSFHLDHLANLI